MGEFETPLKFRVRARVTDLRGVGCVAFNAFSEIDTQRFSGYVFGPGFNKNDFLIYGSKSVVANSYNVSFSNSLVWNTYELEIEGDGTIRASVNGVIHRVFTNKRLSKGTVGLSPSCREVEIDFIEVETNVPVALNLARGAFSNVLQSSKQFDGASRLAVDGSVRQTLGKGSCTH